MTYKQLSKVIALNITAQTSPICVVLVTAVLASMALTSASCLHVTLIHVTKIDHHIRWPHARPKLCFIRRKGELMIQKTGVAVSSRYEEIQNIS